VTQSFSVTQGAVSLTPVVGSTPQVGNLGSFFSNPLAVIVRDQGNNLVVAATVIFSAPGSGASGGPMAATVTSNASGIASIPFKANSTAGVYTVTATSGASTANFTLTNALETMSVNPGSTPQSANLGVAFASPLSVTVKTGAHPVAGVNVTFTAPASGVSGVFSNNATTITVATNASGIASASFTAASTPLTGGSFTVTAASPGLSASFALTDSPAGLEATAGGPQNTNAGTAFATPLTAVVFGLASSGKLVGQPGVNVTFTAPGSGASAVFSNNASTITVATDAHGFAVASLKANATAGSYTVTASSPGLQTVKFALANAGPAASMAANAGSTSQRTMVNTPFPNPLRVTVVDALKTPVQGVSVTFTAPAKGGSGTFSNGGTTISVATDASGTASAPFTANATASLSYTVTAAVPRLAPITLSLSNIGPPVSMKADPGSTPQSITAPSIFLPSPNQVPLGVTVRDSLSDPVPGINVTFTAPASGPSLSFLFNGKSIGTSVTVTTDASGHASSGSVQVGIPGNYIVTASASGLATVDFSITNVIGPPNSVNISGNNQQAKPGTAFASPLSALVSDINGTPIAGAQVVFTSPATASGPSGTFSNGGTTITVATNASGIAVAPITATQAAGPPYGVQASVRGASGYLAASFSLTNVGPPAGIYCPETYNGFLDLGPLCGPPSQRAAFDTPFPSPFAAYVTDSFGNGLDGVSVTFTPVGGFNTGYFQVLTPYCYGPNPPGYSQPTPPCPTSMTVVTSGGYTPGVYLWAGAYLTGYNVNITAGSVSSLLGSSSVYGAYRFRNCSQDPKTNPLSCAP
jgi:hypothetical protein